MHKGLAALVIAIQAANAGAAPVLEEVVVTAQKRSQNLNDVSASINAFDADQINALGVMQPADIAAYSPGVYIKPTVGDQNPVITIRGVGFNDFTSIQNPGAGVYVDQVVVPYHPMMSFQLLDLERVEVLKGPQGTLYGRNSTAGALNFVSQKPAREFAAKLSADYSRWDTTNIEAAVSGPLTDALSARLAVSKYDRADSYMQNRRHPDSSIGEKDRLAYRLSLAWEQDGFDALLNIHGGKDESSQVALEHVASFDATTFAEPCAPVAAGQRAEGPCINAGGYFDADGNPYSGDYSVEGGGVDNEGNGFGLVMNWTLANDMTLTSVTGYDEFERRQLQDIDASPFVFIDVTFRDDTEAFSQELRLAGSSEQSNWLLGIFYSDDSVDALQSVAIGDLVGVAGAAANVTNKQDSTSYALFANMDWALSDTVTLLAGLRYTDEEKSWQGGSVATVLGVNNLSTADVDDTDLSGQLGLEYRPDDGQMYYLKASKGFRSGGFPGGFAALPQSLQPFDSETVLAYETGFKLSLLQGAMQLNAAAYYYDWKDLQTQFSEERGGFISLFLTNAGDADIYGLDIDLDWAVTENLLLTGGLNLMDSEISSNDVRLDGKELANAPQLSYNLRLQYSVDLQGMVLQMAVDSSYTDERFFTTDNTPVFRDDDYLLTNARIALQAPDGAWEVALWGRNIADEEYRTEGFNQFGFAGSSYHAYGEPANYGISVKLAWQ
jgi:iron complex outermembrane receptor protein